MTEQNPNPQTETQQAGTTEQTQTTRQAAPGPQEEELDPNSNVLARVLMQDVVEGIDYRPNTFVQFKAKQAIPLEKAGRIDTSDEAVAYCKRAKLEKVVHEDLKKELNAPKKKSRK